MRKRTVTTTVIDWQGITLSVGYEPDRFGIGGQFPNPIGQLEIRVLAPANAAVPITETGYRSHFVYLDAIAQAGGPAAYTQAWLDAEAQSSAWREYQQAARQLSLF